MKMAWFLKRSLYYTFNKHYTIDYNWQFSNNWIKHEKIKIKKYIYLD